MSTSGVRPINALFHFSCSASLARALGMKKMVRLPRSHLPFPVYETVTTHHACVHTEEGHFAWLWTLDRQHPLIDSGLS